MRQVQSLVLNSRWATIKYLASPFLRQIGQKQRPHGKGAHVNHAKPTKSAATARSQSTSVAKIVYQKCSLCPVSWLRLWTRNFSATVRIADHHSLVMSEADFGYRTLAETSSLCSSPDNLWITDRYMPPSATAASYCCQSNSRARSRNARCARTIHCNARRSHTPRLEKGWASASYRNATILYCEHARDTATHA